MKSITKVADGLFTSKINYGLQLYGKVRTNSEDPTNGDLDSIQMVQNKLARLMNGKTLQDKIPTKELLANLKMLSVNQLNAKIKIMEVWKSFNVLRYPLIIDTQKPSPDVINTRAMTSHRPIEENMSTLLDKTCVSDSIKLWIKIPEEIKNCKSKFQLKKLAKEFALTLPV